jgi:hypothetical protein
MQSMRYWRQSPVAHHPTFSEEVLKSLGRRRSCGSSLRLTPLSKVLAHLLDDPSLALTHEPRRCHALRLSNLCKQVGIVHHVLADDDHRYVCTRTGVGNNHLLSPGDIRHRHRHRHRQQQACNIRGCFHGCIMCARCSDLACCVITPGTLSLGDKTDRRDGLH